MFSESTKELVGSINNMIAKLSSMVSAVFDVMKRSLGSVYSVMWDGQTSKTATVMDPRHQQKIEECRNNYLLQLNELRKMQDFAMKLLGIEREEMELDLVAVDTFDQRMEKKMEEAKRNGSFIDVRHHGFWGCFAQCFVAGSESTHAINSYFSLSVMRF